MTVKRTNLPAVIKHASDCPCSCPALANLAPGHSSPNRSRESNGPVVWDGNSVSGKQVLTKVTVELDGSAILREIETPNSGDARINKCRSYFGVKVGNEPGREVIAVVAASGTGVLADD